MTEESSDALRYVRVRVNAGSGTAIVSVESSADPTFRKSEVTRRNLWCIRALFVFIILAAAGTVWLLFHPQAVDSVARAVWMR